jgi:chloramphenicol-sensitive protein RarD
VFAIGVLAIKRRLPELATAFRTPSTRRALLASTTLISANWLLFIWAVNTGRVLEASLGYYVNPIVNVVLGRIFLRERLMRLQQLAVLLAVAGVVYLALGIGRLPWVSLVLAITFGLYGLVRKTAKLEALTGLAAETAIATPIALGYLLVVAARGGPVLGPSARETWFLIASGVATALPLWWFAVAARRLRYSTLGILQYIAPTGHLLLAVLAYGEEFTRRHAIAFALIWSGVALYSVSALRAGMAAAPVAPEAPERA